MNKEPKSKKVVKLGAFIAVALALAFAGLAVGIIVAGFNRKERYKKVSNEFVETVGHVEANRHVSTDDGYRYKITIVYEVDGVNYSFESSSEFYEPQPVGAIGTVLYDPANPSDGLLDFENEDNSFELLLPGSIILFVSVVVLAFVPVWFKIEMNKAKSKEDEDNIDLPKDINTIKCPYCGHINPVAKEKCEACGAKLRGK